MSPQGCRGQDFLKFALGGVFVSSYQTGDVIHVGSGRLSDSHM